MPVVDLPSFGPIIAPGDHENPATRQDVDAAAMYKGRIDAVFLHNAHGITGHDLAAAHLHLQETSTSFLNAQAAPNVAPPEMQQFLAALQDIRQEMNAHLQGIRQDLQGVRQDMNARLQGVRQEIRNESQRIQNVIAGVREITVESAILVAQNTNRIRAEGTVLPLIPVRYPNGRLPQANRPPLTSLAAINALNYPMARAYARSYELDVQHATAQQYRDAIARHVGAISE